MVFPGEESKLLVNGGSRAEEVVGIWLFGCSIGVICMLAVGSFTRLTRSGLSMTDWKFTGTLPPSSDDVNRDMKIEEFKFIYRKEYEYRMWGRALGVMFALPYSYFLHKGYITLRLGLRLSFLFALGAGQGLIGWWVKSGLEEPPSEYSQPRVSPYRVAAHLTSAIAIFCGLVWNVISVYLPESQPPAESPTWVHAAKVRRLALPISVLVGLTAVYGAFVTGNDVAHAFNTFPKMGDTWIPQDIFEMKPLIHNFFKYTSTLQLGHCLLETATLISVGILWLSSRKLKLAPRDVIGIAFGLAAIQVPVGIFVSLQSYQLDSLPDSETGLMRFVPQHGALSLLMYMLLLNHTVRRPSLPLLKSLPQVVKAH
uniref:Cytochrome c oxidase assembly protein COX15 isogeny n=1 Tax=Cajanus cajan TaxID=3821 RepID=A0A151U2I1_CAJCA|nr:Cytochrome c oxidase assembly protein COX15 isogeny [Cajanus cajan]